MAAQKASSSLRFSRQEHWSGLPFPSPVHESEKWKWSRSVVSESLWPHGLQPTRLLHPWDFPGKSSGVGCHCLLQECSDYRTIALISHASKVMHNILRARLQQYMNRELPDVPAGFRKDRGTRDQIANIDGSSKNQESFRKYRLLLYWLHQSLGLCGSQQPVENSERDGNTRPPDLPPEKYVCRSKSNS